MEYPYVIMVRGKPETLLSPRDFEYLLDRHMGPDSYEYFHRLRMEKRELEKELEQVRDELGAVLAEQEGRRWEE